MSTEIAATHPDRSVSGSPAHCEIGTNRGDRRSVSPKLACKLVAPQIAGNVLFGYSRVCPEGQPMPFRRTLTAICPCRTRRESPSVMRDYLCRELRSERRQCAGKQRHERQASQRCRFPISS